jgi:hypothetical protein
MTTAVCEAWSTTAIELDRLTFLKDTSNGKEQPNKQQDFSRRKELKEEEAGTRNSSTDIVNSGSGPDYQNYIPLGWAPWWG